MFSLKRKMKEVKLEKKGITAGRVSIRDKLLVKGKLCAKTKSFRIVNKKNCPSSNVCFFKDL